LGGILFDVEAGIPCTRVVFFDRDVFHVNVVWEWSVESYRNVDVVAVDFLECQESTSIGATLLIEFETPLAIRETPILMWRFPVYRPNRVAFLLELPEVLDVGGDLLDSLLKDCRVDVRQISSPVFQIGYLISDLCDALFDSPLGFGYPVVAVECVVVELSHGVTHPVQLLPLLTVRKQPILECVIHAPYPNYLPVGS
ncbi:hypothetical protein, partial [Halorientalis persicus]